MEPANRPRLFVGWCQTDLRSWLLDSLLRYLGSEAERYVQLAHGIDHRPVVPDRQAKSIGHEQTFSVDVGDVDEVRRVLLDEVEQVGARLRRHGLQARGVSLKIRFGEFETISRSATLKAATNITSELWQAAKGLFEAWAYVPVRLIGFTAEKLSAGEVQNELFPDQDREKQRKLDAVADAINAKFGKKRIGRGGST